MIQYILKAIGYSYFCGLEHSKSHCFSCQLTKINFGVPIQIICYPSINANVAIRTSDSQQEYVVLNAMRRSGGI